MGRFATPLATLTCLITIGASTSSIAQQAATMPLPRQQDVVRAGDKLAPLPMHHIDEVVRDVQHATNRVRVPKIVDPAVQEGLPGVTVGQTYYDFQTNGAMANRLTYYEEAGEKYVQMLWMVSEDPTREAATGALGANPARGSFYTFMDVADPAQPLVGIEDWKRIEPDRAGWPSIIQFSDGSVGTPSHVPIRFWRNGSVGDDIFLGDQVPSSGDEKLWPRAAIGNDEVIHLIYSSRSSDNRVAQVLYRRSTDYGLNWTPEIQFTGQAGLGSSTQNPLYNSLGGDTYCIAARGDTVAVFYLDNPVRQLWMRLSTDNGATWPLENTRVMAAPRWREIDSSTYSVGGVDSVLIRTDTAITPGQDIDAIIDSKGVIHFVYSEHYSSVEWRRQANQTNRSGLIFTDMVNDQSFRNAGMWYGNTADSLVYKIAPVGGGEWDGEGKFVNRRFYSGGCRYPQFGLDAEDNVYLAYMSCKSGDFEEVQIDTTPQFVEGEPDTLSTVQGLFGHIYLTHKLAGYPFWSQPVGITPDGVNCQFPTMADQVMNGQMYLAYSWNATPGDHVTNTELSEEFTNVNFAAIPTAQLSTISSVQDDNDGGARMVSIIPNPAADAATVKFEGVTKSNVVVSVVSSLGQTLMTSTSPAGMLAHGVTIPTQQLPNGTYLIVIEADGIRISRTLSVVH